jgi:multidrug resistance protein MdtO
MGAVVALVGRLVDIAANLSQLKIDASDDDRLQFRQLANKIAGVRAALIQRRVPSPIDMEHTIHSVPLLQELDATVSLVPAVFTGSQSLSAFAPQPASGDPPSRFFIPDAFSNPEHMKFALRGCLAASLCYIIYNAKDWPDISTSVTTCFLTALSTIGSSHQKQIFAHRRCHRRRPGVGHRSANIHSAVSRLGHRFYSSFPGGHDSGRLAGNFRSAALLFRRPDSRRFLSH